MQTTATIVRPWQIHQFWSTFKRKLNIENLPETRMAIASCVCHKWVSYWAIVKKQLTKTMPVYILLTHTCAQYVGNQHSRETWLYAILSEWGLKLRWQEFHTLNQYSWSLRQTSASIALRGQTRFRQSLIPTRSAYFCWLCAILLKIGNRHGLVC